MHLEGSLPQSNDGFSGGGGVGQGAMPHPFFALAIFVCTGLYCLKM